MVIATGKGDETFEANPETERVLLDAIAQGERGDTIPMATLLGEGRWSESMKHLRARGHHHSRSRQTQPGRNE